MRPALCALLRAAPPRQVTAQRRGSEPYKQKWGAGGGRVAQASACHLHSLKQPSRSSTERRALASREGVETDAPSGTPQWLGGAAACC